MSTTHHREALLEAITRDLIGPHGPPSEELLGVGGQKPPRPDDVYLTGLLLPLEPDRTDDERDEHEAIADEDSGAVGDGEESGTDDPGEGVPAFLAARPRVMGVSVAVPEDASEVHVTVRAARYVPFWAVEGQRTFEQGENDDRDACWQRRPLVAKGSVSVAGAGTSASLSDVGLEPVEGAIDGLRCRARKLRVGSAIHITVSVENTLQQEPGGFARNCATWFQASLEVRTPNGFVPRPDVRGGADDPDRRSNRVLYRNVREWAVGHTCSATWDNDENPSTISTTWLPVQHVASMSADGNAIFLEKMTALKGTKAAADLAAAKTGEALAALLAYIPAAYSEWLDKQKARVGSLPPSLQSQATRHTEDAAAALERIKKGLEALKTEPMAFEAFRLAQEAMELQSSWKGQGLRWRPFQLGFILASLPGLVWPKDGDSVSTARRTMDLLWFPTGGGKTEAYLGLSAFTLFFRRLRDRGEESGGEGVTILMRYTLRLLTTQQFERGAAMILACELIRRRQKSLAKAAPFSIGLWVGNSTTPASVYDARNSAVGEKAAMLKKCPCCQRALKWDADKPNGAYVVICANKSGKCALSRPDFGPLPVYTIDELVFDNCPSLVLGTVDKFAQIVRTQSLRTGPGDKDRRRVHGGSHLFGIARGYRPPELIIQDELHLISGPLGTITAIYEAAIDRICTHAGVPPKVVGSTATIRRAEDQVLRLFNREVFQFPPAVLDHDDSCFAVVDRKVPGRLYVGVTTAGRSAKFTLASLMASILQRASEDAVVPKALRDPWWTLLAYFNSLRELGGALVMMHDDVPAAIGVRAALAGTTAREPSGVSELTSRIRSEEIPDILEALQRKYADPTEPQEIDVVLATNMISVGVDIPRLGVMVVNGQPRSMSEYIQATSRVGRNAVPGLIFTSYNASRPRDLSHFEAFRTWHGALYREVESTSVTPWAPRAREKALHAAVVALARHLMPTLATDDEVTDAQANEDALLELADCIVQRARESDDQHPEYRAVEDEIRQFVHAWGDRSGSLRSYWNDFNPSTALLYSWEEEARRRQVGKESGGATPTPNSMRDVEPSVWFRLVSSLSSGRRTE